MKLSAVVITFNEEKNIERFLKSVNDLADEIVVVDSFSTDRTRELAEKFEKVRFITHEFSGYGTQKNYALAQCKGEWVLFPDADEILDEEARKEIVTITSHDKPEFNVYNVTFRNIFLGRALKYGGWGKIQRPRLFKRKYGKYTEDIVHEHFISDASTGKISGFIDHYTYRDIFHHIEKSNRYTSMMAEKMHLQEKKSGLLKIVFKPFYQFIKSYIIRVGFLDGMAGFYLAVTASFYTFLKYLKLYELQTGKKS